VQIPLFPLGVVLFPGGLLPLRVFETRYVDMTRDCLKKDLPFGVCLIREGKEVGAPAVPESVGCLARIVNWDMQQLGVLNLSTVGNERFRVLGTQSNSQGLVLGEVELMPHEPDAPVPQSLLHCVELVRHVVQDAGEEVFAGPHRYDSASWVGYRLAEILPLPMGLRQKLLELEDPLARLALLQEILKTAASGKEP
jgi:Lon protease-like protein